MRIIAGMARGFRISGPPASMAARPTSDKVREALFNIVDVSDCSVLDLFAGSGAVGCEALSRGAKRAVLVEKNRQAIALIKKNLSNVLKLIGSNPSADVVQSDVVKLAKKGFGEKFEFVFCDPPYAMEEASELIENLVSSGVLTSGGTLVFETSSKRVSEMPAPDRIKTYGDSSLLFYYGSSKGKE